jgi:hypothetical protein
MLLCFLLDHDLLRSLENWYTIRCSWSVRSSLSLPCWRHHLGCSCSPSYVGWSRMESMLAPTQSVSLRGAMYTVVKLLRRCLFGLVGSCCVLADSFRHLLVCSTLIPWLLELGSASGISIFGRDAALRLCASPLAIFGGWRCKACLHCRVLWLAL